jgi:hypothetical protein
MCTALASSVPSTENNKKKKKKKKQEFGAALSLVKSLAFITYPTSYENLSTKYFKLIIYEKLV